MKKIKLLIGLPGASQESFGTQLTKEGFCFLENADFDKENINLYLRQFKGYEFLCLTSIQFIEDKSLTKSIEILKSEFPNAELEFVYFENNPLKCIKNLEYKNHGDNTKNFDYIHDLSKKYHIPQDVTYINIQLLEENH